MSNKKQESNAVYNFTKDWFTNNVQRWQTHLKHFKGTPCKALELGSFEGRSAIWLLENILTHPNSNITCVDNFNFNHNVENVDGVEVKARFVKNTKPFGKKVKLYTMDTRDALKLPKLTQQQFDLVYIDAGRHSKNVLEDAILAFPLLKEGGTIIFDDYTTSKDHDYTCPKKGIDAFLDIFSNELRVRSTSWQVIATKKTPKVLPKFCHSELFSRS